MGEVCNVHHGSVTPGGYNRLGSTRWGSYVRGKIGFSLVVSVFVCVTEILQTQEDQRPTFKVY